MPQTILYLDTDLVITSVVKNIFNSSDLSLLTCSNIAEAEALYQQHRPSVLIYNLHSSLEFCLEFVNKIAVSHVRSFALLGSKNLGDINFRIKFKRFFIEEHKSLDTFNTENLTSIFLSFIEKIEADAPEQESDALESKRSSAVQNVLSEVKIILEKKRLEEEALKGTETAVVPPSPKEAPVVQKVITPARVQPSSSSKEDTSGADALKERLANILADSKKVRQFGSPKDDTEEKPKENRKLRPFALVAIGISTGGPNVLREVLPQLEADFPVPILIVQHMLAGFTRDFANNLALDCKLKVFEINEKCSVKPGEIGIASGSAHLQVLGCSGNEIMVESQGTERFNSHCPSVGVMYNSIAKNDLASRTLAVIMTGMGSDGSREIGQIQDLNGHTMAQDEASSTIFGMPRVAIQEGKIDTIFAGSDFPQVLPQIIAERIQKSK